MKNYTLRKLVKLSFHVLLAFCFLFAQINAFAQGEKTITGTVLNPSGQPVEGATIAVKNSKTATTTNQLGKFSINAPASAVLVVSYVGFTNKEIELNGQETVAVTLAATDQALDDVVVVAYGTVRKKDLTGSVSVVDVKDAKKTASYDVAKLLQGQAAGVSVQGSGEPGGFVQIKIRGISNFGNNSPLFVIDGVPVDAPFDFPTDDIETIQVLKDASASALYGSRAATGVIIITTKKGKAGPPRVNFSGYAGYQTVPKKLSVLDRTGYQKVVNEATKNAGLSTVPANDASSPNFSTTNTDWQDEALKTGTIQNYSVGVSGGSNALQYNLSLGYFDQSGYQVGPQAYKRYNVNANLQGKKGKLGYGLKTTYTYSKKGNYSGTANHAVFGGTVTAMLTAIPTVPVYDEKRKGGYGGSDQTINRAISANVVGLNEIVDDYSERNRILINGWADFEIIKNLKYKISATFDRTDYQNYHYEPKFDMGFYYVNNEYYYHQDAGQPNMQLIEHTLTYNIEKGAHRVDLLAGYTFQKNKNSWLSGSARDTADLDFQTFRNAPANKVTLDEWRGTATQTGIIGRINYSYDDRYLVTGNFRRDGSSKFAPDNRYGNFGGVAVAWNVHNEKFIPLPDAISMLKVRASWGTLGNQLNLGYYDWQSFINNASNYNFNDATARGATTVSVTDPFLKWESTTTKNIGVDFGLWQDRLTFTAEYFDKKSTDIITSLPLPYSAGSIPASYVTNAASVINKGFEFTLGYRKTSGNFTYRINANFSTLDNEVLSLGGDNNPIYGSGSKTEVGRSVGELFGYQTQGIFQTQAEINSHAFQSALTAPGDVIFKAQQDGKNNDHSYQLTDANDRVYLGRTIPKYYYGLNVDLAYKNFDFSLFFQGSAGNKVFNAVYQALMTGDYGNQHTDELNYWTAGNTNTNVPRPIIGDPNGNTRFSDRFIEDGSYVKLQNLQLGYNLPGNSKLIKKNIVSTFRIYFSAQNLFTISNYKGYDPDFISDGLFSRGFDYGSFPNPRTLMIGINASF